MDKGKKLKKVVLERDKYEPESWALYCDVLGLDPKTTEKLIVTDNGSIQLHPYTEANL